MCGTVEEAASRSWSRDTQHSRWIALHTAQFLIAQCTLHCTLHGIHCTVHYTVHFTVYIALYTTLYTSRYTLHCTLHCTLHSIHCTVHYTVHFTVHIALYTKLYTSRYTLHCTLHCTLHGIHCTVHYTALWRRFWMNGFTNWVTITDFSSNSRENLFLRHKLTNPFIQNLLYTRVSQEYYLATLQPAI